MEIELSPRFEPNFVGKGIFLLQFWKGKIDAHNIRQRSFDRTHDNVISCRFCQLYVATSKPKWKYFHIGQAFSKKKRRFLYRTVEMKRRYWQQQMCIKISHGYLISRNVKCPGSMSDIVILDRQDITNRYCNHLAIDCNRTGVFLLSPFMYPR